jgi:2-dehydropantoate 2-reductase
MMNLIWNPLCAITQSSPGHIVSSPRAEALVRELIAEGRSVAHGLGMPVVVDEDQEIQRVRNNLTQQPSMLQDMRAGRAIETDAIVNSVVELADLAGVPTPALRHVASLLEVLNQTTARTQAGIGLIQR